MSHIIFLLLIILMNEYLCSGRANFHKHTRAIISGTLIGHISAL